MAEVPKGEVELPELIMLQNVESTLESSVPSVNWEKQSAKQGPNLLGQFHECKHLGRLKTVYSKGHSIGGK